MRLGGVLGMIFGPTVLLIALNLVKLGLFDGVRADAEAAVEDVIAILRERPFKYDQQVVDALAAFLQSAQGKEFVQTLQQ